MPRLEIDHDRCIRSGECYLASPELFKAGEDGFPIVLVEHPEGAELEAAESAAYACPGRAISVVKKDTREHA